LPPPFSCGGPRIVPTSGLSAPDAANRQQAMLPLRGGPATLPVNTIGSIARICGRFATPLPERQKIRLRGAASRIVS
jgi:hypothetical protein